MSTLTEVDRESFKSKPRALGTVAGAVAALIQAGDYADLFGYDITCNLTEAQNRRLDWAVDEVMSRLHKMGVRE